MKRALSRKYAYRKSLLRNLATSLILYEQITTTEAKAKEVKPIIERLINYAKKNNLTARRYLLSYLFDKNATKKVFEVLVPRYEKIRSGYIKNYKIKARIGDGAQMMIMKLINFKEEINDPMLQSELQDEVVGKGQDDKISDKTGKKANKATEKVVRTGSKISRSKKIK